MIQTNLPRLVVLTGGPGAGKTAVLEVVRRDLGDRVVVLPEAAGILFSGGFPRRATLPARRAAQRAIYHVQRQLECMAVDEAARPTILCDRGTVDGTAYWPGDPLELFAEVGSTLETELARYYAVIHLETPAADEGYNNNNPVRVESAEQAADIDERLRSVWGAHPHRHFVGAAPHFVDKLDAALRLIREHVSDPR